MLKSRTSSFRTECFGLKRLFGKFQFVVQLGSSETLGPGTVKFLLKYSKLEFMVSGPQCV